MCNNKLRARYVAEKLLKDELLLSRTVVALNLLNNKPSINEWYNNMAIMPVFINYIPHDNHNYKHTN